MRTIYVDMDGVLADFDRFVLEKTGRLFNDYSSRQEAWDSVKGYPDLYKRLTPIPDAHDLLKGINSIIDTIGDFGIQIEVLTAIPKIGKIPTAKEDKRFWILKHFDVYFDAFNIGPLAEHKQYHCVPGDILIDDTSRNIKQWNSRGGIGILHTSATSTLLALEKVFYAS